ncbi:hypothetical protein LCGC14_3009510 [marine sediment metagenome]|uniref:Uncharacterized protein n=1 Tax=marine sediment metagenome TaxID=412755 RepID=A0A0F8XLG6_9ZZZZ
MFTWSTTSLGNHLDVKRVFGYHPLGAATVNPHLSHAISLFQYLPGFECIERFEHLDLHSQFSGIIVMLGPTSGNNGWP